MARRAACLRNSILGVTVNCSSKVMPATSKRLAGLLMPSTVGPDSYPPKQLGRLVAILGKGTKRIGSENGQNQYP